MRSVGSAAVGALVMATVLGAGLFCGWKRLGAEEALLPGTYDASPAWMLTRYALTILAGLAGGYVSAALDGTMRAPRILAAAAFAAGALVLVVTWPSARAVNPRGDVVTFVDAVRLTREPAWLVSLWPLVGASGVLMGALRRAQGRDSGA